MGKTAQKSPRAQQSSDIVELTKPQKMAGNARASKRSALAKRPQKQRRALKEPSVLTQAEKDRFFKVIKSVRDRSIFRLLYHCGMRASEIGLLQLSDYREGNSLDFDRLYIRRLKNSISAETCLVPEASKALRAWLRRRGRAPGPLFPSRQRGPISRFRIFSLTRKYCELANIARQKSHPHVWKHSACVHLLADKKEGLVDVQKHVGHRDVRSTMRYLNLSEEFNAERIKRLRDWK
jgi:integrase